MMRFFLKHPRFWGDLFIAVAVIGSNAGSAWAGSVYHSRISAPDSFGNSAPANIGFQIMGTTVYPLATALLVLGVWLKGKHHKEAMNYK